MFDNEMNLYHNKIALLEHLEDYGGETLIFLPHISDELKDDREIVLAFLKINAMQLDLVNEKFKDDEEIVSFAVAQNVNALQYASLRLQKKLSKKV